MIRQILEAITEAVNADVIGNLLQKEGWWMVASTRRKENLETVFQLVWINDELGDNVRVVVTHYPWTSDMSGAVKRIEFKRHAAEPSEFLSHMMPLPSKLTLKGDEITKSRVHSLLQAMKRGDPL